MTHQSGFAEVRQKIAAALARAFRKAVSADTRAVEEALALFATDRNIHPGLLRVITDFYDGGDDRREAFFTILASLDHPKVDFILNQIHAAMDTPEWLIALRADLGAVIGRLSEARPQPANLQRLTALAALFSDHFMRIFNFQYLVTRLCNTQNTSIALLKFISEKEGVHPADNWWNFENRLNSPDRIIITLEHFKMPYTPLVYIEVALSKGLIRRISRIIGESRRPPDLRRADTAIFYSVNTTLAGLEGLALGAKMITRARDYIERHYPRIRRFATLSPVPGFRDYLDRVLAGDRGFLLTAEKIDANKRGRFFTPAEARALAGALEAAGEKGAGALPLSVLLSKALGTAGWHENLPIRRAAEHPLVELTRYYLTREKRPGRGQGERLPNAYDPVANFHLSNGASIAGINYLANPSGRGMGESYGMMVNYRYERERQERNKLLYSSGKVVVEE
jgi:malonyl-CoA decarboxylase